MALDVEKVFDKLFPICRSITGDGYRESFNILKEYLPFKKYKYKSGKKVFDWIVPKEWNIKEAYIKNSSDKKVIDFKNHNLHVLNYSIPINKTMSLKMLNNKLYSIPHQPNDIPYVTSYYERNWGFCLSDNQRLKLKEDTYNVVINSNLKNGFVEWGDYTLKKNINDESINKDTILLTSYLCHPSLANNELSGPLIQALLYNKLKKLKKRKFNYRFLIAPETIGSICFIHKNLNFLKNNIFGGLILNCLGGPKKKLSYKLSRRRNTFFDRYFINLSKNKKILIRDFEAQGSDERQYCSSELNLPMGQLARTIYGKYKQYHTSADNKKFVKLNNFEDTAEEIFSFLCDIENQNFLKRRQPYCELQLGKRNLYHSINTPFSWKESINDKSFSLEKIRVITEILSFADGETSLEELKCSMNQNDSTLLIYKKLKKLKILF